MRRSWRRRQPRNAGSGRRSPGSGGHRRPPPCRAPAPARVSARRWPGHEPRQSRRALARDGPTPGVGSALGVLRSLAGLLEAVLLALDHAGVAGEETALLQLGPQLDVELDQGPGDAVAQRAGLPGDTAAVEAGDDVVALQRVGDPQRLGDDAAVGRVGEVVLERATVQLERAGPLDQTYPCHRLLAAAGATGELRGNCHSSPPIALLYCCLAPESGPTSRVLGRWAACGWVWPSASTTYHSRLMSCGRGENVRWLARGMRATPWVIRGMVGDTASVTTPVTPNA